MVKSECEVSVLCTTYNQAIYLRKALDSIISQVTDFPFELIIHDDASNDGTIDIIREYEKNYSDRIRGVIEEENQYSKGVDYIFKVINKYATGKYIAFCEGDDFWTDTDKLQIQRDALNSHPECDMCACLGSTITEDGETEVSLISPLDRDGVLPLSDVIIGGGQYLVTAGLLFRKEICENMFGLDSLDYSFQIRGALRGGIYYIHRNMAVYRRYAKGSWTNNVLRNSQELDKQWDKERKLLHSFDQHTNYLYHAVIQERLKAYTPFEDQLEENKEAIQAIFRSCEHPVYIWGMGRRGTSLEAYCRKKGFMIAGVCDAANMDIGKETSCGNRICSTEEVLADAKTILASNRFAYYDLVDSDYDGELINFQQYMPYG